MWVVVNGKGGIEWVMVNRKGSIECMDSGGQHGWGRVGSGVCYQATYYSARYFSFHKLVIR